MPLLGPFFCNCGSLKRSSLGLLIITHFQHDYRWIRPRVPDQQKKKKRFTSASSRWTDRVSGSRSCSRVFFWSSLLWFACRNVSRRKDVSLYFVFFRRPRTQVRRFFLLLLSQLLCVCVCVCVCVIESGGGGGVGVGRRDVQKEKGAKGTFFF